MQVAVDRVRNRTTGTAPFTVASTTKVDNLNVDQLDSLDSAAFLRANASDTFEGGNTLTIAGTLSATGDAYLGNSTGIWNSSGNVGIGNTAPGSYQLNVTGNTYIGSTLTIGSIASVADNDRVLTDDSGVVKYIDTSSWDKDSGDDVSLSYVKWMLNGDSVSMKHKTGNSS